MLECVINVSEGRDARLVGRLAEAVAGVPGGRLLDIHSDADHNRSVFTLTGVDAPRALTRRCVELLDITGHSGVHPRLGVVDVVPFVALDGSSHTDALAARDGFAQWAADELRLPVFLYGPERTLPDVRRGAWKTLQPDLGPHRPHPSAGAVCVGVRPVLIAYNVLLATPDLTIAKAIAARVRRPGLRTLAFMVGDAAQVSMNIVDADDISISTAYDAVAAEATAAGTRVVAAELVGLITERHLQMNDPSRWVLLDIGPDRTVESRLK
ncbi:MAG: hypothetical protein RL743_198 [Actinomycetota bacterium]